MAILLDTVVLFLFILFIVSGFKSGMIRSLIGFIGTVIAFVLSLYLSNIVADFIYNNYINNVLVSQINETLNQNISYDINYKSAAIFNGLPSFLSGYLAISGITPDIISNVIESSTDNASHEIVKLISPAVVNTIRTIVMSILFLIISMIVGLFVRTIKKVVRIPVLRQVDQILGALIGGCKCFIILILITFLLKIFLPMSSNIPEIFSKNTIDSTFLFRTFYDKNPIYEFMTSGLTGKMQINL